MKIKFFALALGLMFVGFSPLTALALPDGASNMPWLAQGGPDGGKGERWLQQLNLSPQQQQQLSAIRQKYKGQMEPIRQQLRANQDELRQLMASDTTNVASIRAKHDQITGLRQQLEKLRFESMLESRDILSPEQRQQLAQLMNARRAKWQNKRQGANNQ
ncbi:Spy/CpxP family protein refolding chaperone [Synechocystis sp. LKSZ1]|uniref:Spy/CpxP family protein refolding chaperone n=1 Tax=Synechocystis sp. LKSZ1 TaxID=3144951 RepID=UPI00336BEB52